MAGTSLPRSITDIPDTTLRWQASRTWQAATALLGCIEKWQRWVAQWEAGARASAFVICMEAWELREEAGRAANTLCDTGCVDEDITPAGIVALFPTPPTPIALSQKQYDLDETCRRLDGLIDNLAPLLVVIRIHAETCPRIPLTPPVAKSNDADSEDGRVDAERSRKQGDEKGTGISALERALPPTVPIRDAALLQLKPVIRKAFAAFEYAEASNGRRLEDREAYDWLRKNGIDAAKDDYGSLADYGLPNSFETFKRYLTAARKPLGENKYTRRAGRTGRSIVRKSDVE